MKDETAGGAHWSFWIIGVVTLIYNFSGVINFFSQMNADTVSAMPEMYRAMIEGRPVWATGGFAAAVFGGTLGCLLLLFRMVAAYYVFFASLLGAIVTMTHVLAVARPDFGPFEFLIGNLVQLVVTAFLIWYSKQAQRRGWIS